MVLYSPFETPKDTMRDKMIKESDIMVIPCVLMSSKTSCGAVSSTT